MIDISKFKMLELEGVYSRSRLKLKAFMGKIQSEFAILFSSLNRPRVPGLLYITKVGSHIAI